jgi:hypothetical protein
MKPQSDLPTEHRLARLVAWTMAVIAWFMLGAPAHTERRRRLARATIGDIQRFARSLIIIRAAQLLPMRAPRPRYGRRPPHFSERRIAGAWLRRRLITRGSFAEQLVHLLETLRDWRALGAELAHRRRKRLTRLTSISPARTRAPEPYGAPARLPAVSDSS